MTKEATENKKDVDSEIGGCESPLVPVVTIGPVLCTAVTAVTAVTTPFLTKQERILWCSPAAILQKDVWWGCARCSASRVSSAGGDLSRHGRGFSVRMSARAGSRTMPGSVHCRTFEEIAAWHRSGSS